MEFWKTGRNNIRVTRFLTAAVLPLFLEAESKSFCRSGPPATAISLDSRNVMIETKMCAGDPLTEEAGGGWEGNPGGGQSSRIPPPATHWGAVGGVQEPIGLFWHSDTPKNQPPLPLI